MLQLVPQSQKQMAHIALSAYKVTSGGILGYITRITTDLPKLFPEHQYTIFLNEKLNYLPQYENSTHVYLEDSNRGKFDRLRWEQLILPRELKSRNVDLLYTFSPSDIYFACLLYTSPSPRDRTRSRMPSSA